MRIAMLGVEWDFWRMCDVCGILLDLLREHKRLKGHPVYTVTLMEI